MSENCKYCGRLHPWAFGFAMGIIWAVALFIFAMTSTPTLGYAVGFVQGIGTVYLGYHSGFTGGIIGAIWGFFDAGIGGLIFAWLYNVFAGKCSCNKEN